MSIKYPLLDQIQVETILKRIGLKFKHYSKSSHAQWEGYVKKQRRVVTVDKLKSKKEKYSHALIKRMIQQSGLSKKEFYSYL